ncbi:hypothetical protein VI817_010072 [Penicillium citrinum]|uniref:Uncharacterized protein n=1 Tax=Penicillium hetheringtonii TaxID=911720 RepID=A0AAD6DEZ0_9EURO|nr:hypothetical protein N7450_007805 [Penicillium hetheringtonii]KAK5787575.1 hypothetical protein VI817_010072 [Penicillium citrinum]
MPRENAPRQSQEGRNEIAIEGWAWSSIGVYAKEVGVSAQGGENVATKCGSGMQAIGVYQTAQPAVLTI